MTLSIRRFCEADRAAVIELWEACGLTREWNNPALDIDRKLARDPQLFFVGLGHDAVIASFMLGYDGHRGWIYYLAVNPHYQGQQLGRQLMDFAEQRLIELGCAKLNLQVRRSNEAAMAFYTALGYQHDEVLCFGKRLIVDE